MNTELLIVVLFLYWFFPYWSQASQLIKKNVLLEFLKSMIKPPLIWIISLTLFPNFQITLGLMKSNGYVALLNALHLDLQQCHNLCQWADINSISFIHSLLKNRWPGSRLLCSIIHKMMLTLNVLCISDSYIEIKIKLNFYFHTSLWCLKRFYEGL